MLEANIHLLFFILASIGAAVGSLLSGYDRYLAISTFTYSRGWLAMANQNIEIRIFELNRMIMLTITHKRLAFHGIYRTACFLQRYKIYL